AVLIEGLVGYEAQELQPKLEAVREQLIGAIDAGGPHAGSLVLLVGRLAPHGPEWEAALERAMSATGVGAVRTSTAVSWGVGTYVARHPAAESMILRAEESDDPQRRLMALNAWAFSAMDWGSPETRLKAATNFRRFVDDPDPQVEAKAIELIARYSFGCDACQQTAEEAWVMVLKRRDVNRQAIFGGLAMVGHFISFETSVWLLRDEGAAAGAYQPRVAAVLEQARQSVEWRQRLEDALKEPGLLPAHDAAIRAELERVNAIVK
ncbi:MAG: hypothetical protein ACOYN0_14440, partial [Phycisphaerales bacterium]